MRFNRFQELPVRIRNVGLTVGGAALALAAALPASAQTYALDPQHSQPFYEVSHMGYSLQRGAFTGATGTITLDRAARKGTIDVSIDASTVRTSDPKLDTKMRGEDFFNVAKYPTMTFKSSQLTFDGDRLVGADGELTMRGVTKPVKLTVENFVCGLHPYTKNPICGAEVTATIKRSDWGMTYLAPKMVGDDVKITIPVEAYRQ
jgi:polyisoprenoid-binding protein YceI